MAKFRPDWGQKLWDTLEPRSDWAEKQADAAADKLLASKWRYQAIERETGVPWFWIAGAHWRESGADFRGVLHNGQKIIGTGRQTTIVPAGRGPFLSWEEAAVDALELKQLHKVNDEERPGIEWTLNRILYEWERYNGFGYLGKVNSPYVWSFSNHHDKGKYVKDGVYNPNAPDQQIGVAMILRSLITKDAEVAKYIESEQTKPVEQEIESSLERLHSLIDEIEGLGFAVSLRRIKRA